MPTRPVDDGARMHSIRPPITDRKIRFALAGCGRIAASHFNAIE